MWVGFQTAVVHGVPAVLSTPLMIADELTHTGCTTPRYAASIQLASPPLTSPHLASPRLTSRRLPCSMCLELSVDADVDLVLTEYTLK